jgi:hypothetical protein
VWVVIRRYLKDFVRYVSTHLTLRLMHEVLRDLGDEACAHGFPQGGSQRAQKRRACHQYEAIELILTARRLEYPEDLTGEELRLLLVRASFAPGGMVRHGGAPLARGRCTIEHTTGPVGSEVAIAQAAAGVLDAASQPKGNARSPNVIEPRFALICHYDSYTHLTPL